MKIRVNGLESDEDGIFWCAMCGEQAGECDCTGCGCPTQEEYDEALREYAAKEASKMMDEQAKLDCGHEAQVEYAVGAGHGTTEDGKRICFDCCAKRDRELMQRDGRTVLYLSHRRTIRHLGMADHNVCANPQHWKITNWPGTLRYEPVRVKRGRGCGFYGNEYPIVSVWFKDEHGALWYGRNAGDNEIVRCRRLKS